MIDTRRVPGFVLLAALAMLALDARAAPAVTLCVNPGGIGGAGRGVGRARSTPEITNCVVAGGRTGVSVQAKVDVRRSTVPARRRAVFEAP